MIEALHLWVSPLDCDPPHKVGYPEKVEALQKMFAQNGWDMSHPRLLGYPSEKRIQLLSGSHRWAASVGVLEEIPVSVIPFDAVQKSWGNLALWSNLMKSGGVS